MYKLSERYRYATTPVAKSDAIIKGDKYRFTVLSDRLIRIEYSETGVFEDRATQTVINRDFDIPEFTVTEDDEKLQISTEYFTLTYYTGRVFTQNSLSAKLKGIFNNNVWRFNNPHPFPPLKGTIRTLDTINGETELEDSIMSANSFTQIDDSKSLIICDDGEIKPRQTVQTDIYLFAHTKDYYGLLKDFYKLTGSTPLLPRYALGNMWSRYYKYRQQEYIDLMDRFAAEGCPFSVAVIDMDWHLVNYDTRYGTGWTGYTWNKDFFPDYKQFLTDLHERGLEPTLNLHPAEGVVPYEEMYQEMADAMGVTNGDTVPFDITDPKFIENYFKILHHPYEKDGISFWWMDWQQGNNTKYEGLDPLWMLNHYHALDMINSGRRPLMLSRYAGIGSHRYPIGFSGDTIVTWESLDFQPYFTASASNIGYTWWSHDIGGHMLGYRDDELNTRWIQLGVFSPINRLHSSCHPLTGKEPWNYDEVSEKVIKNFLQLRHELIPYLYTMNYRTAEKCEPLVAPLYYKHPTTHEAFDKQFRNEFYFGSEMLVSPITQPADNATRLGSVLTYIPDGTWFDFFNGIRYNGGKTIRLYRNLHEMPVLVKAGGIIPLAADGIKNDTSNPKNIRLRVFAGADNTFEMYEDDGISTDYKNGAYAFTKFELNTAKNFIIHTPNGDKSVIPSGRSYEVEFNGFDEFANISVTENGQAKNFEVKNTDSKTTVIIADVTGEVIIDFGGNPGLAEPDNTHALTELLRRYYGDYDIKQKLYEQIFDDNDSVENILLFMNRKNVDTNVKDAVSELLTADK